MAAGDVLPAIVTKVLSVKFINLQVFLDGGDSYWVSSSVEGTEPRQWQWMALDEPGNDSIG